TSSQHWVQTAAPPWMRCGVCCWQITQYDQIKSPSRSGTFPPLVGNSQGSDTKKLLSLCHLGQQIVVALLEVVVLSLQVGVVVQQLRVLSFKLGDLRVKRAGGRRHRRRPVLPSLRHQTS